METGYLMISCPCPNSSSLPYRLNLYGVVYIFLTALFLWVPIQFSGSFPILVQALSIYVLAALLTIRYYLSLDKAERRLNLLSYGMILYALWVLISTGMHFLALNSLESETYLSTLNVEQLNTDNYWALWTLFHTAQIYLFFLSLFIVSIVIFRSTEDGWIKLTWIPIIFIPCLLVALYQFYIDISFLNNRPHRDWLGGLGTDLSAFRSSLFLIFPLCVLTIINAQSWWKKILYASLAVVIVWLARLSDSRVFVLGMIIFISMIPLIGVWVHGVRSCMGRRYLYIMLVGMLVLTLLMGIAVLKKDSSVLVLLERRSQGALTNALHGNLIEEISDRVEMWYQAWRLIKLSPIAGWGPGGFLRNVDRIRFVNGDPFVEIQYAPSLYLDRGTDLGLLGLGGVLFLYIVPLSMFFNIRKRVQIQEERWAVGIIFTTLTLMLLLFNAGPHTNFPEVQWIYLLYLGFLISVALKYGYKIYTIKNLGWGVGALFLTALFIAGTYTTTFGSKGYKTIYNSVLKPYQSIYGYYYDYHGEDWAGEKAQWITKNTVNTVQASSNIIRLKFLVPPRNSLGRDILRVKVFLNDNALDERHFLRGGEYNLSYYIPGIENKTIQIRTELNQTRNPYRGGDFDFSGIVQSVTFLKAIPEDGVGFYQWQKMGKRRPPGWPQESKTERFRWTGIQASMNISKNLRNTGIIYLMSLHPQLDQNPVVLDILCDGRMIKKEIFHDYNVWRKVYFKPGELNNFKTLTFRVDKTWNPLLAGFSDDPRDLGIYMIVPEIE